MIAIVLVESMTVWYEMSWLCCSMVCYGVVWYEIVWWRNSWYDAEWQDGRWNFSWIVRHTNGCTGPHKTHASLQTSELGLLCCRRTQLNRLNVVNSGTFPRERQKAKSFDTIK